MVKSRTFQFPTELCGISTGNPSPSHNWLGLRGKATETIGFVCCLSVVQSPFFQHGRGPDSSQLCLFSSHSATVFCIIDFEWWLFPLSVLKLSRGAYFTICLWQQNYSLTKGSVVQIQFQFRFLCMQGMSEWSHCRHFKQEALMNQSSVRNYNPGFCLAVTLWTDSIFCRFFSWRLGVGVVVIHQDGHYWKPVSKSFPVQISYR